ncbi:MAG: RNA methyltransferase [Bacteroidales bacterium]|jgi:tRNA G18 (ribose-2'-O)-methylase SpoU|nr:RNA methyltransferase [Bacteroidales bacterium]MCL2738879.1 RNA methyltransferase [Bacteroidales bacterium]
MPRKLLNAELQRLSPQAYRNAPKLPIVLVLDNIRSQHNIGAAFRTADAFCIERICLCGISAVPPGPEIHKSALGAEDTVPWSYFSHTAEAVTQLHEEGYTVLCIEQVEKAYSLHLFTPQKDTKYALVFGNEVRGIQQEVVDMGDGNIEIPQFGTKHSLNVSVSIGVVLWDFLVKLHGR